MTYTKNIFSNAQSRFKNTLDFILNDFENHGKTILKKRSRRQKNTKKNECLKNIILLQSLVVLR